MTTFRWNGGSVFPAQGRYQTPSDWTNLGSGLVGDGVPQAGDTAAIAGSAGTNVVTSGAVLVLPANAGGYTQVVFFRRSRCRLPSLIPMPSSATPSPTSI